MPQENDAVGSALRNFFLQEFNKGRSPGTPDSDDPVFTFEQIAVSISPEEYMREGDPNTFSQEKVNEAFSRIMTDNATIKQGDYRFPATESFSDAYFFQLVGPSQFVSNPEATPEANQEAVGWFATLKAKAKSEFKTVVSITGVADEYAPSQALPDAWLDPRRPELWKQYSFAARDEPEPAASTATTPVKHAKLGLMWRSLDERAVGARLAQIAPEVAEPPAPPPPPPPAGPAVVRPMRAHLAGAFAGRATPATSAASAARMGKASAILARSGVAAALRAEAPAARNAKLMQLVRATPRPSPKPNELPLKAQIALRPAIVKVLSDAVVETKPSVEQVKVSFGYQIVRVSRPWLFFSFLRNPNWCVPGVKRGFFSNPDDPDADGPLSLVPVALVVVRDVSIEANWTQADMAELSRAFAIGPFASGNKPEIVGQTLRCKGVQILGCINERMPMLPPRSDPALG